MFKKEWKHGLLGDGIHLVSGQHIAAKHYSVKPIGMPYLTGPSDFDGRTPIATKYTDQPRVCCKAGDILVTVKGSGTGSVAIADKDYCISRQLMAVRPTQFDAGFVCCVLERNTKQYNLSAAGLIPGITREDILFTPLEIPPIGVQKKIAEVIFTWDISIEKTEKLIEAKEERKRGLAQKLLFGKVKLSGRKSHSYLNKRWFSIPSDWQAVKIGRIAKEVKVKNTDGSELPVLSCTKHHGLVDSLRYFDKQVFSKDTSTYKIVSRHQFAYATNHIEEGSIGYQDSYPRGLISPMYTVFVADHKKINDGYLYKLLKMETFRRIFAIHTNASVDRRGSLRWKEFAKLLVPLPELEKQNEINAVLDAAEKEIDLLQRLLDLLKKQKRGLMQKLLTGQWRVKIPEEAI